MRDELEKFWTQDAQKAAEELMMPTGEPGAVLIAAILVLIGLWQVPALLRPPPAVAPGISRVDVRGAVPPRADQLHHNG